MRTLLCGGAVVTSVNSLLGRDVLDVVGQGVFVNRTIVEPDATAIVFEPRITGALSCDACHRLAVGRFRA